MRRVWGVLTWRGRWLLAVGLVVLLTAMFTGQRDVMRVGLLLLALPVIALVLVLRARLRMSAERSVEPAQVALGTPMHGRITLGHDSLLPAALLELEDRVPPELGEAPRFLVDEASSRWQRTVEYPLLGRARGHYRTGPLMVRTTDPFGLVRVDRTFTATSEVVVTPQVFDLTHTAGGGTGGSAGEAQPRRLGITGADDVLVREYRQGDGYAVDVVTTEDRLQTAHGAAGPVAADVLLQQLTDLQPGRGRDLGPLLGALEGERGEQLVVAVLGRLSPEEAYAVAALRRHRATGLAMVLDVDTWTDGARARPATGADVADPTARAAEVLAEQGWRVVVVTAATSVPEAWSALERTAVAA